MSTSLSFDQFLLAVRAQQKTPWVYRGRLIALDPGETTGHSIWDSHDGGTHYELFASGQMTSWDPKMPKQTSGPILPAANNFPILLSQYEPNTCVLESYRVYSWHTEDHAWSDVPTLRIIGSFETRLHDHHIPYFFQTAQVAKTFVTDDLLHQWGFYKKGERHARDSIRHALFFILFGPQGKQPSAHNLT